MGSITLTASADVACWTNEAYGAGLGPHLPVGYWGSATYRSAIRFNAPSWAGWTRITKATLNVYISDHAHVGVRNSTILVRRQNTSSLWTKSAGTQDCNDGFSSSNNTQNSDLTSSSTDQATFSSGTTANAKKSITVTNAVTYYFNAKTGVIVFTLAGNSSSDYTELWSREKGSTYDATLVIEYEDDTVPNAPTLNSPAEGEVVASQNPTFSWTHSDPQGSALVNSEFHIPGVTTVEVGAVQSYALPNTLGRGESFQWMVRTADSLGYGPWSALRNFSVAGYVVPTITAKYLVWNNGWPRPRINWTWSPPDGRYATQHRVMWDGYDSGWIAGNPGDHIASSWNTSENQTLTNVKVWVQDSFGIISEANVGNWATRFGVSQHRKDLGSVPLTWGTPTVDATIYGNGGGAVVVQYGSNSSATSDPTAWYDTLSSVPKDQFLFIKYWFLHSTDLRMPTIHRHIVPTSNTVQTLDHWKQWSGVPFGPPWGIDSGEYVYGTRSVTVVPDTRPGVWNRGLHSELVQLRAGRSYILSGLMKSQGDSGANLTLLSEAGNGLVASETIHETRDWFKADNLDTYRYKSPVYVSPTDQKVFAYLTVGPNPDNYVVIDPDRNGGDMTMWSAINCSPPHLEDGSGGVPASIAGGAFYVGLMEVYNATISSRGNYALGTIPVTPGKRYKMRLATYVGGPDFNVGIWYLTAGGGWIETAGQILVTGGWAYWDIDGGVAPAGAAMACCGIAYGNGNVWAAWDAVTIYEDYSTQAWFDAIKIEESTVATPWSPGAVGASAVDAGGVQIDGSKGAVFRYRGISGGAHNVVEGGYGGLKFGPMEIAASSAEGALDVSSSVAGTGAVIRVLGSGSTEAVEFYDNGNARLSMYTNDTQRLNVSAIIQPYAAAATGVQTSSHDENGNPYWGKIAQGRIEGQWRWGGITAICRTRYCVDIVSLHIMTDPAPPDQPYVDLNVKRLSKRSAGNKYIVGIDMDSGGCNWKLWGSAGQAYDAMTSFVQAVHVNGGWAWAVKPDSLEYSADPPGGWIYSAMYEQFVGSATP